VVSSFIVGFSKKWRWLVFDVPNIVERNKYSYVDSIIRVHLICFVLQQYWNENVVPLLS
jgi:hypothetical protein